MIKVFFKNSIIYTLGIILTRGIGIFMIPIYTRYFSPAEYGIIDLFAIITSIISLTIALEIHQAVVRFYQDANNEQDKTEYVSSAFIFSIFVYSLYFIISFLFSDSLVVLILDEIKYKELFIISSLSIAISGLFYFTSGQLKWQILPKQFVIVSVINVITVSSVSLYLLIIEDMKLESIFIGQIFGNILGIVMSIYFTSKSYKLVFNYLKFKEMISFSYPLVFSGIAVFVTLFIDRIIINQFLGLSELGIYGLAYRFASMASLVMIGFQSSLSPLIYKHYKEDNTKNNIAKLFDIFVIFAFIVISASILFSKELIFFLSTVEFAEAAIFISPLIISVFFSNMYIFSPGIVIAKKTKLQIFISFSSAIINTILNYLMIPIWGLLGAALATVISSIIVFTIYILISNKYYEINYNWNKKILLFIIVLIVSNVTYYLLDTISLDNFFIKIIIIFFLIVFISIIILGIEDLKKIKKSIV